MLLTRELSSASSFLSKGTYSQVGAPGTKRIIGAEETAIEGNDLEKTVCKIKSGQERINP